jgi:hypothetical protein
MGVFNAASSENLPMKLTPSAKFLTRGANEKGNERQAGMYSVQIVICSTAAMQGVDLLEQTKARGQSATGFSFVRYHYLCSGFSRFSQHSHRSYPL